MFERVYKMDNRINNFSFGSSIKLTTRSGVLNEIIDFQHKPTINYPWSIHQTLKAPQAYTDGIQDCTAGGILVGENKDNIKDVVMFHICPDTPDNKDFNLIKETLLKKIGNDTPIQGFLLGSRNAFKESAMMFSNLENFIKQTLKIPYTKMQGLKLVEKDNYADIAYDKIKNQWTIFVEELNPFKSDIEENLRGHFNDVFICEKDCLSDSGHKEF